MTERVKAAQQGDVDRSPADTTRDDPSSTDPPSTVPSSARPTSTDRPSTGPFDRDSAEPAELTVFVPERLALAYERRRRAWTTTDTAAAWLLAANLLLLLVIVGRGSYYIDDLRAQGYALDQPFLQFIVGSNGTHFAPVPRILDWIQSRVFPLEHGPAVAVTLVVRALLAVGFWRVLRRLFGPRPVVLVPFAMLLFTPALLQSTTYYRQSITILACTVAIVWTLDAHLRWVLYRHRADLVTLVILTAIALACYEKAAVIPVLLLVVTLVIFGGRPRRPAAQAKQTGIWRGPVGSGTVAALLSAVMVLIFLVIYRSGPYDQGSPTGLPSVLDVLRLTWDTTRRTMIPLLLGGPFHWGYPAPYTGTALVSGTTVAFLMILVLIATLYALWRNPGRTGRALILLFTWTLPSVAIVAVGRFEALGLQLGISARLWADLVPGFLLAGALAALPWRVGVHRVSPSPRPASARSGSVTGPSAEAGPVEISVPALAGGLVVLAILAGSVYSSLTYASKWWDNPTGQWIANARLSLENAEPYPRTLATPLPLDVMPAFVSQVFPSDAPLLLLLRPDMRFHDADGETKVMNSSGVRSAYIPSMLAETPTKGLCAATLPIGGAPVTLRFPSAAPYLIGAQLEVGLLLAESTKIEVTVTTPNGTVLTPQRFSDDVLPKGPHTLRFPVPYLQSIQSVTVRAFVTKTNCVVSARVWAPMS